MESSTRLWLLGAPSAEAAGQPIRGFESRKAFALLGYLASQNTALPRAQLAALFWPDHSDERARSNLRVLLHNLTSVLPGALIVDRQTVRLAGAPACWTDTAEFEKLAAENTLAALAAAADLYRSAFLDGLYLDGCPEAETWLAQQREHWHERAAHVLTELTARAHERQEWAAALRSVDRLLNLDPWREAAHQNKMRLLALSGQRDSALAQYEICRRVLADELGLDPSSETTALYEQIRDGVLGPLSAGPEAPRSRVPIPPTPLLGRAYELAQIGQLLAQPECRLLTLLGSGGVGKTRLALEVAAYQQTHFDNGAAVVELATIRDPGLVAATIAQALGLPERGARPADELVAWLRDTHMLLYLDNFEQVLAAAPLIDELLAHCPRLHILITSRMPLHIRREYAFLLGPLALPDMSHPLAPAEVGESPAVALFVRCAQSVNPDFQLSDAHILAIAEICHRLDGLPLAIELAAARVKLFPPLALRARLEQRLPLLTNGARDLPERQRTLRMTIAWSEQLLAHAEQRLFRALGVCLGGCTLEAAEQLAADTLPPETNVLDLLAVLVDSSLLRQEAGRDGLIRFTMLETIREYTLERLATKGELADDRRRHAQLFLALAEAARPHLHDERQEVWLDRLATEHDNLRAALEWSCAPGGEAMLGLRLAEVLCEFWLVRGYVGEGRVWVAALLDLPAAQAPSLARAHVLGGAGRLAWAHNDWAQATTLLEASQSLCATLGDLAGSANALNYLGEVAAAQSKYDQAAGLFERSLALFQQLGEREGSAAVLGSYGQMLLAQGQHERAAELVAASLGLFEQLGEQLGDRRGFASTLTVQGQIMHQLGEYARADQLFGRSLELFRSLGYRHGMNWALTNQGQTLLEQGEYARAEQIFAQSLALYEELGDGRGQAWALVNQGQAAHACGEYARAIGALERGVELFKALGDGRGHAWALYHAGRSLCAQGSYAPATARLMASLRIFHALDDAWFSVACLSGLAAVCLGRANQRAAVCLLAAADMLRTRSQTFSTVAEDTASLLALRQSLDATTFAIAWEAGCRMMVDQVLAGEDDLLRGALAPALEAV